MNVELPGKLEEHRVPDRLVVGVATDGDGLHVVEDEHPGNEAQDQEALDEEADEGLLVQPGRPAYERPAAVREPTGQDGAGGRLGLGEGEVAHLAPVDLEVLSRQSLEAHGDIGEGSLRLEANLADVVAEHRAPAAGRVVCVGSGQLEHPHDGELLAQPQLDLVGERVDARAAIPLCRLLVDWLLEHPGDGHPTQTEFPGDLALAPATLGQQVNCAALHLP
jgi:hypothetical protein